MKDYKVPSPKEIKEKYQKSLLVEEPLGVYFQRPISKYLTWFVLHFTLCAEFIALMTPVVDIIAIVLISKGNFFLAAILTQVHMLVDCVDGEVARFRKTVRERTEQQGRWGGYVDSMAGTIGFPFVIFATGYFLGDMVTGVIGMGAFYAVVLSSSYAGAHFPNRKKSLSAEIKGPLLKRNIPTPSFDSSTQKTLITLALLFQSLIFLWIFIAGAAMMILLRLYLYRK